MTITWIIAGLLVSGFAFVLGSALAGRLLGLTAEKLVIGVGPGLIETQIGGCDARLALLPLTASTTFRPSGSHGPGFDRLPRPLAVLLQFAGPLAMLAAAMLPLGSQALQVAAGVWMGVLALASPAGPDVMRAAADALAAAPPLRAIGLVMAGNAAVQLLPIPPLSAGMALLYAIFGFKGLETSPLAQLLLKAGLLVCIMLVLAALLHLWGVLTG